MNKLGLTLIMLALIGGLVSAMQVNGTGNVIVTQSGSNTIYIQTTDTQSEIMLPNFFMIVVGAILLGIYTQENSDVLFKFIWLMAGLSFILGGFLIENNPVLLAPATAFGGVLVVTLIIIFYRLTMNFIKR